MSNQIKYLIRETLPGAGNIITKGVDSSLFSMSYRMKLKKICREARRGTHYTTEERRKETEGAHYCTHTPR